MEDGGTIRYEHPMLGTYSAPAELVNDLLIEAPPGGSLEELRTICLEVHADATDEILTAWATMPILGCAVACAEWRSGR